MDTPLDDVAAPLALLVELERPPRAARAAFALIPPLGNRVRDAPSAQLLATRGIAVACVREQMGRPLARTPPIAGPRDPNRVEHRPQLRAVMPLAGREHYR